jgi:hypothetical protein
MRGAPRVLSKVVLHVGIKQKWCLLGVRVPSLGCRMVSTIEGYSRRKGVQGLRRILLILTLIAMLAVMLVGAVAFPALAQSFCEWEYVDEGWWAYWCWSPDFGWWIADWWKAW